MSILLSFSNKIYIVFTLHVPYSTKVSHYNVKPYITISSSDVIQQERISGYVFDTLQSLMDVFERQTIYLLTSAPSFLFRNAKM